MAADTATATETETATPETAGGLGVPQINAVTPDQAVAASGQKIKILGSGFDARATVALNDTSIDRTTFRQVGASTLLEFALPRSVAPGRYIIGLSEPDGRTATWKGTLLVEPHLTLAIHVPRTVVRGHSLSIDISSLASAHMQVRAKDPHGHALPLKQIKLHALGHGKWRASISLSHSISLGTLSVTVHAALGAQRQQATRLIHVTAR